MSDRRGVVCRFINGLELKPFFCLYVCLCGKGETITGLLCLRCSSVKNEALSEESQTPAT